VVCSEKPPTTSTHSVQSDSEEDVSLAPLADRLHYLDNCTESTLDVNPLTTSKDTITTLLPPDLVDSESEDEDPGNETPSPVMHSSGDEQGNEAVNFEVDDNTTEGKVGRWTYSKGATRKPAKSRPTVRLEDSDNLGTIAGRESERLLLYRESQRLLRETQIHLQEHRPKQFKRFSEFRQSLHSSVVPVLSEPENIRAPIYDHPAGSSLSESQETVEKDNPQPVCDILDPDPQLEVVDNDVLDPLNQIQAESSACVSEPVLTVARPLPASLFPACKFSEDDEGFVDLGQSVLPVADRQLTPADRLMARFQAHIHTPTVRKESGPIEYSVVTKVTDDASGNEQLRLSSVIYKSEAQPDSLRGNQGRKSWRQHREHLKEQMRQRRLEQYEARMKEEGNKAETDIPRDKDESSDCDGEWSEGDEEISSTESTSSSSSDSETEEDGDGSVDVQDEDDADDILNTSRQRCLRRCAFADDEAEESEHDEDEDLNHCLNEDASTSTDKLCLDNTRRPQGTLGPGDVDLFASEYSTILDHSSAHSASEDTVLLAPSSDSPLKLPSFSTSARSDDARHSATQDTVILAVSSESLLKLSSSSISMTQDSQNEHEQRRLLFASFSRLDSVDGSASDAGTFDGTALNSSDRVTEESPSTNTMGRQLFTNVSNADSLSEKENREKVDTHQTATQDSQELHEKRCQIFSALDGSGQSYAADDRHCFAECEDLSTISLDLGVPPSDLSVVNSDGIKSFDGSPHALSLDSQIEHSRRRDLFADSTFPINLGPNVEEPIARLDSLFAFQQCDFSDEPLNVPTFCAQSSATSDIHETRSSTANGAEQINQSESLERDTVKDADGVDMETNRTHRHRILVLEDDESLQSLGKSPLRKMDHPEGLVDDILPKLPPMSPSFQVNLSIEPKSDYTKEYVEDSSKVDEDLGSEDDDRSDDEIDSDGSEKELTLNQSDVYESDEEEAQRMAITQDKPKTKRTFRMQNFLDEEAELSGDENERAYYMDDDEPDDSDADLDDPGLIDDENVPSGGRLRRQVERVHQRLQADQDQRELRFLKELYFEDGDLHAENGRTRQRRFRWRGLESEDPLDNTIVDGQGNDSDDEEDQDRIPFGPMDRWLQGATHHKSKTATAKEIDLDASVIHEDADTANNDSDGDTESAMSASDDEEEEKENTQPSQVLSLGRQAVLKAKIQETQIVVVPVNKKTIEKPFAPIKSHTLTNYLQVKQTNAPAVINPGTLTTGLHRPNSVHAFLTPAVPAPENRLKISKRGSLLGRVPTLSRPNSSNNLCDSADTDVIVISDEDSSSSNSSLSGQRRNPAHFLDLRNKPIHPLDSGKRASSGSTPTNIKRQRSISVFSALL
ncbi:uncharacterized protein DEA37_0004736, partial [Paragonimus westermani]